jgi:hypothetical protein
MLLLQFGERCLYLGLRACAHAGKLVNVGLECMCVSEQEKVIRGRGEREGGRRRGTQKETG